jgi:hypothetical protein
LSAGVRIDDGHRSTADDERVTVAQRWCKPLKRSGSRVTQPSWNQLFNKVSTETVENSDE